jgi:replicative DNA helicase
VLSERGNIYIEDAQFELDSLISIIRQAHKRKGVRFVVIDYLGLIEVNGVQKDAEKISRITRRMKLLANELRIPIVLAAQLNRDLEKRDNKRPQLSDIRGSGTIEQDADVVMFLYRHEVYVQGEKEGLAEIIVAKQRNGPTGIVEVGYLKEQTRFVSRQQIPINVDGFFEDTKAPF